MLRRAFWFLFGVGAGVSGAMLVVRSLLRVRVVTPADLRRAAALSAADMLGAAGRAVRPSPRPVTPG